MIWVVGIGASAGGLEANRRLLTHLTNTGQVACVIANHQAVDGHTQILVRQLSLAAPEWRVREAQDGDPLLPGEISIIPAGQEGTIVNGRMILRARPAHQISSPSVNSLFCSIAKDHGPKAVGVILSGTGSDGVVGCRAIRSGGGLVFAQNDADFQGMPSAAEAASVVDHILSAHEIALRLGDLSGPRARPWTEPRLEDLIDLVRCHTGHDFSGYKPETLARRTLARRNKLGIGSLGDYLDYARAHPEEVKILQKQFLVSLSSFFRDPECFDSLRGILESALRVEEQVSIWTPGCASGEEPYTLAMLVMELDKQAGAKVRVLGSDLNSEAVALAQRGLYSPLSVKALQPGLVQRYFDHTGEQYRVVERLREVCSFRCQDVIRCEAPRDLNLISCRNLLIYLGAELQGELIRKFHKALAPDGILFIGPAETLGPLGTSLFHTLDNQHRIYRRRP